MAKKTKKSVGKSITPKIVGAGVAVLAAGVAGAYFLQSAKKRKQIKGWMLKMKGEALDQVEKLKEVNEEAYHKAVDAAARRYVSLKHIDQKELASLAKELKSHWRRIHKRIKAKSR